MRQKSRETRKSIVNSLYREIIIDHYRNPRNFGSLKRWDFSFEKGNPLCGDKIRMEVKLQTNPNVQNPKQQIIKEIKFSGEGCAISLAAASMLTEKIKGKKIGDLKKLTKDDMVEMLGIELTPTRLRCALLPLEVLQKAIRTKYVQNHHKQNNYQRR